eukprot:3804515-Rhodomonas_salina.3
MPTRSLLRFPRCYDDDDDDDDDSDEVWKWCDEVWEEWGTEGGENARVRGVMHRMEIVRGYALINDHKH